MLYYLFFKWKVAQNIFLFNLNLLNSRIRKRRHSVKALQRNWSGDLAVLNLADI